MQEDNCKPERRASRNRGRYCGTLRNSGTLYLFDTKGFDSADADASPPASELDPMAHYVGVYKSLFGQNDLFGSPERQQIADTAKSQGLSLKELSAVAEKRAKEKRLRALEELEA